MLIQENLLINRKSVSLLTAGTGSKSILFIHGNSMSMNIWQPQLNDQSLSKEYQLIAFDLPGHGHSGWLKENPQDYRPGKLSSIIKSIMDLKNINEFILVGLSFGTNLIGEIDEPIKGCKGIVLISSCIVNDSFPPSEILHPGPNGFVITALDPSDEDLESFVSENIPNSEVGHKYIQSYRKTDPAFREQLGQTLVNGDLSDELENINKWNLPVCVAFGEDDVLIKTNYLNNYKPVWKHVFHIKNAGHIPSEENPPDINNLLMSFAEAVFK